MILQKNFNFVLFSLARINRKLTCWVHDVTVLSEFVLHGAVLITNFSVYNILKLPFTWYFVWNFYRHLHVPYEQIIWAVHFLHQIFINQNWIKRWGFHQLKSRIDYLLRKYDLWPVIMKKIIFFLIRLC